MSDEVRTVVGYSKAIGRYSPSVTRMFNGAALFVSISGQVAVDASGAVQCQDDASGQAEIVFRQLVGLVEKAGGQLSDLMSVTIIITDRSHFKAVNEVRNRFFERHAPASTMLVAQLMEPGCLVEVNGHALITPAAASNAQEPA